MSTLALIVLPPAIVFVALGAPFHLDMPQLGAFNFSGGVTVTSEFAALVFGLVVYTAAFIGEIVRGGIQAVSRGQGEAALALGLRRGPGAPPGRAAASRADDDPAAHQRISEPRQEQHASPSRSASPIISR